MPRCACALGWPLRRLGVYVGARRDTQNSQANPQQYTHTHARTEHNACQGGRPIPETRVPKRAEEMSEQQFRSAGVVSS